MKAELATVKRLAGCSSVSVSADDCEVHGDDGTILAGYNNWREKFAVKAWGDVATYAANMWVESMKHGFSHKEATAKVSHTFAGKKATGQ